METAGLAIQSALARALDQGKYAIIASLDLSAAFDVENIDLLLIDLWLMSGLHNSVTYIVY